VHVPCRGTAPSLTALVKLVHAPDMKQRLSDLGAEPVGSSPENSTAS